MKLKNIPNILSIIRILLVVVFVVVLFGFDELGWALVVFLVAGATDIVDGYLARKYNWITNLGKILDPFADKLMQCTVLISLWIKDILPWWFVVIYIAKEIATLTLGAIVIKRRSVTVVSKWYGKFAVCLFYATIAASIIFNDFLSQHPIVNILIFIPAIICAIAALLGYVKHYAYLKKEKVQKGGIIKNIRKEQ